MTQNRDDSAETPPRSIRQLMDLTGRVAIVTGGAGHIGRAACAALAELGANVCVLDRTAAACSDVADQITNEFDVACLGMPVDLANEDQIRVAPQQAVEKFGRLDILINCAAFVGTSSLPGWAEDFEKQTSDAWRAALELNLTAPFLLAQSAAPFLAVNKSGSIINVSSIYGMLGPDWSLYADTGMKNPAAYGASKGGLIQLTRYLATTLGPDIRVNTVSPGGIKRGQAQAFQERYVAKTPLARMGTEEDLKGAIAYLASDLSAWVTGQNIAVDGGWTSW